MGGPDNGEKDDMDVGWTDGIDDGEMDLMDLH